MTVLGLTGNRLDDGGNETNGISMALTGQPLAQGYQWTEGAK